MWQAKGEENSGNDGLETLGVSLRNEPVWGEGGGREKWEMDIDGRKQRWLWAENGR